MAFEKISKLSLNPDPSHQYRLGLLLNRYRGRPFWKWDLNNFLNMAPEIWQLPHYYRVSILKKLLKHGVVDPTQFEDLPRVIEDNFLDSWKIIQRYNAGDPVLDSRLPHPSENQYVHSICEDHRQDLRHLFQNEGHGQVAPVRMSSDNPYASPMPIDDSRSKEFRSGGEISQAVKDLFGHISQIPCTLDCGAEPPNPREWQEPLENIELRRMSDVTDIGFTPSIEVAFRYPREQEETREVIIVVDPADITRVQEKSRTLCIQTIDGRQYAMEKPSKPKSLFAWLTRLIRQSK